MFMKLQNCYIQLLCKVIVKTTKNYLNLQLILKFSNNLGLKYCNVTFNGPVQKNISFSHIIITTIISVIHPVQVCLHWATSQFANLERYLNQGSLSVEHE